MSQLRRILGAHVVVGRPPGYVLAVEPEAVDAVRFQRLAEQGRKALADGSPEEASDLLSAALLLWRGPAFVDVDLEATRVEASRLDELRLTVLESASVPTWPSVATAPSWPSCRRWSPSIRCGRRYGRS